MLLLGATERLDLLDLLGREIAWDLAAIQLYRLNMAANVLNDLGIGKRGGITDAGQALLL